MKIDCGFWDKDGNYKEDIQEIEMLSVKELNEIELIKAQNEKLKEQNKSLQQEVAELKAYKDVNEDFKTAWEELKAENERLKEEIETRDNLIDHFRDEALYRATIASEYQKDKTKLEQTLQEIKDIAEFHITDADSEDVQNDMEQILDLITKAEEE